jgi:hypothetical protein
VEASEIAADRFTVEAHEGSQVKLVGAADSIEVTLASGGRLDARGFHVDGAEVALSGASLAQLCSDGPVTGTVVGSSVLDNLLGEGTCAGVSSDPTSQLHCTPNW